MDGRLTRTNCDEAGDYVVHNVLSPKDLVSRPDNMDETVLSSHLQNRMANQSQISCAESMVKGNSPGMDVMHPYMSLVVRKPVFGISDQVPHKPGCTVTEDGRMHEILDLARRWIVLSV